MIVESRPQVHVKLWVGGSGQVNIWWPGDETLQKSHRVAWTCMAERCKSCDRVSLLCLNSNSMRVTRSAASGRRVCVCVCVVSLTSPESNDCNYQGCYNNSWMCSDLQCCLPPPHPPTPTHSHTHSHTHSCTYTPDMRTGSSSLTVFMELTNICLCSWCVSSCCLSSIILDILVIPEEKRENGENLQCCKI